METGLGPVSRSTTTGMSPAVNPSPPVVRRGAWAGIAYAAAWLIGLFLAPSAPDAFGSAGTVSAYYTGHRSATMIQSVFVHGLAGIALLVFTAALWGYLAAGRQAVLRRLVLLSGVLAAAISFVQVAFMIGIYVQAGRHGSAESIKALFDAINKADTVKLIMLAVFVGAASDVSRRLGRLPRWVAWEGAVTVVFLVAGGLAFLVSSSALNLALDISLPLLLLWAAAASISMLRRTARARTT